MFVKLGKIDIENCKQALESLDDLTDSEKRTVEKLKAIQFLQSQKDQRSVTVDSNERN